MKKFLCLILAFSLLIMTSLSVGAALNDFSDTGKTVLQHEDWMLEEIEQGTRWELDQYVGTAETVYVPRFYNNKLIITLGDYCFMNNTSVKNVITSSPLWRIGEYAFIDCTSLESIELNFALDTIGIGAFSGTSALKDINLQDCIVTEIRPFTFLNSGIEKVELPETCTSIGNYAFGQCSSLTKITIPKSVTEIHQDAFARSNNLVIYCYTDSYAHQYAVAEDIPFVLLDAEPEGYFLGDTDNNQNVDVVDATWIQRYIALMNIGVIEDTVMQGDVDGDGVPSVVDATFILRYCVSISTPYDIGEFVSLT